MDVERYGPWALIVGGSEGVGAAFAQKLADRGFKLVLVARKEGPLEELAGELRAKGAEVRILSADMSRPDALDHVRRVTDDVEVGLLIYNAGANKVRGNFIELEPQAFRDLIAINVGGQTEFTRHYGALMKARGRGGIILCGSQGGYIGAANLATYTASKAFSRVFSEALWAECRQFGIDVLHLNIGFTATPAMVRSGWDLSKAQTSDEVAQEGIDNIANGPVWIVGGEANVQRAIARSTVTDRAKAVLELSSPPTVQTKA